MSGVNNVILKKKVKKKKYIYMYKCTKVIHVIIDRNQCIKQKKKKKKLCMHI